MEGKHILYVEDDKFLYTVMIRALEQSGFRVTLAKDGVEALDILDSFTPDFILLDLLLPKIDGFGVLEKMREDPSKKGIPVIVLSNLGSKEDTEKSKEFGVYKYFIKAYTIPRQIVGEIEKYFNKK